MYLLLFLMLFCGCQENGADLPSLKVSIPGRLGKEIYYAEVPVHWKSIPPSPEQNLQDTTLPIYTFLIGKEPSIRLTVHTFPGYSLETRIPPETQIKRWEKQFQDPHADITKTAHGGFGGYRIEAYNKHSKRPSALLGYSMQLNSQLFQILEIPHTEEEKEVFFEMRADYTIKAVGSPEMILRYRKEIDAFAESFELIDPIPL